MDGKLLTCFVGLLSVSAVAVAPLRLSPVLPEVTANLDQAQADVNSNTFPMARARAQLVLLGPRIPYTVAFQGVPASHQDEYVECLNSAMQEWEKDLEGAVHFVRVDSSQPSSVLVRFRTSVVMKKEQVAGYVNWNRSIKTEADGTVTPQFKADMQIRVKDLENRNMPSVAMRHAAMHELGHVLGLDDSPREGDVMGPLDIENPVSAPTPLEVSTVRSFRDRASEILKEAQGNIPSDLPEPKS